MTALSLFSRKPSAPILKEPLVTVFPKRPADRQRMVEWYRQEVAFRGCGEDGVRNANAIARYLATAMRIPFVVEMNGEHMRHMEIIRPA